MSALAYDGATVAILWKRDLMLFLRQPSRLVGALLTPLLLWLAIGAGIAPSFSAAGGEVGYLEYFFPGVVLVLLLQVSISSTISVIEDRREGFLQGVLAAPGSRTALVLGKTAGSASVALIHALLFVALAPVAGIAWNGISWWWLLLAAGLASTALCGLGFAIAWGLDSIQGYHVLMNLLLFPMWILSGAMYPVDGLPPALAFVVRFNPMTYAMAAIRRGLYGGGMPGEASSGWSAAATEFAVLGGATLVLLMLAARTAKRNRA